MPANRPSVGTAAGAEAVVGVGVVVAVGADEASVVVDACVPVASGAVTGLRDVDDGWLLVCDDEQLARSTRLATTV